MTDIERIENLELALGPDLAAALPRLAEALTGTAPIHPVPAHPVPSSFPPNAGSSHFGTHTSVPNQDLPALGGKPRRGLAVVVGTSGSTGTPKLAMLSAAALRASIDGTHAHLGGPGQWVLALPPHHIAGLQVLLRGIVAGTETIALPRPFTIDEFITATDQLTSGEPHYTALVPTQVTRLLEHPGGPEALREFDAVLVGGAALPPQLRERANHHDIRLVATYGMSETAGGCVYDGIPLPGIRIRLDEEGRIHLGGATVADGYFDDPERTAASFHTEVDDDGTLTRWFRTDDHGTFLDDGRLHVDGRLDDLINTGGLKVSPRLIEEALRDHLPEIVDVCVVGVPDPEWGQAVAAALVPRDLANPTTHLTRDEVRTRLRGILPDHALPQRVVALPVIPQRGPGKPDRRAVADLIDKG